MLSNLGIAGQFKSGHAERAQNRAKIQCNPIIVGDGLYTLSPPLKAFADVIENQEQTHEKATLPSLYPK